MALDNRFDFTESPCFNFKFNWTIPNYKNIPGSGLRNALSSSDKCNLSFILIFKITSGPTKKLKIGLSKILSDSHDDVLFSFEFHDFLGETFSKDSMEFLLHDQEHYSREVTKPISANARHMHYVSIRGHIVVKQRCETVVVDPKPTDKALVQLQQDFKDIFQSGLAADLVLNSGNEIFKLHKTVLCARSPVFRRMLINDMVERRQNAVTIEDIHSAVLKDFITFLYTGEIGQFSFEATCQLYSVGDKYEVLSLQKKCRSLLNSCLSDHNVSEILELADMHSDCELEEIATKFICENFKTVSETADWKKLININSLLASRTLQKVSSHLSTLK